MSGVWKKPSRELQTFDIPASKNIEAPEVPQAAQTPVATETVKPAVVGKVVGQTVGEGRRKLQAGALAQEDPGAVNKDIDARVFRTTRRVLPLQLTVDPEVNYWFRAECYRRYEQRLGHHKLSDLFLLCIEAYKRENGLT